MKTDFDWTKNLGSGTQPVSVLQHNIIDCLEKTTPAFTSELKKLVQTIGLKPGISFHCNSDPIFGKNATGKAVTRAASVSSEHRIKLHETFLSYLWCISYSLVVLYAECNARPARGLPTSKHHVRQAQRLFQYALGLRTKFERWPLTDLPNPQIYDLDAKKHIEDTNGVFCFAVAFVLLHEIAHVHLTHTQKLGKKISDKKSVKREMAADKWAIEKLRSGFGNKLDANKSCGVVAGLISLLLLSSTLGRTTHPDQDDRLRDGVVNLRLSDKSTVWMIAAVGVRLWEQANKHSLTWPTVVVPPKDFFLKTIEAMTKHKLKLAKRP